MSLAFWILAALSLVQTGVVVWLYRRLTRVSVNALLALKLAEQILTGELPPIAALRLLLRCREAILTGTAVKGPIPLSGPFRRHPGPPQKSEASH